MKQITAKNQMTTAIYRFKKNIVFVKCNNMQYSKEIITKLQEKGWEVTKSFSWIKCEYPREQISLEKGETEADIEISLINTFLINLKQAGFEIKLEEIEE